MNGRSRSTPYAILGMLSLAPMSGYDIRKEAATSIGYFWSESYGQIYPALRELKARGWIKRRPGKRAGSRDRHVYEITERGREALAVWRAEPPRDAPFRNELLLKLFFGGRDSVGREIEWIDRQLARERQALYEFGRIREQLMKEQREHPSLPFWLMTLSYGEHRSRALMRWSRETQKTLRAMERGGEKRGPK
ncbi:MAG TPA: PadR family transcriptional regulator [Methylomirabilota bacterium]|nr:PadR family transcriptional regulator [Methylomirabilota bacterium]